MDKITPCVYLLASKKNGTLYVGVTSNLLKRVHVHKEKFTEGFSKKYSVHNLVYYEFHPTLAEAFKREKQIKGWKRQWKITLIEKNNKEWKDLYDNLY